MFYRKCLVLDGGVNFNNFSDTEATQDQLDAEFADADKTRRELEREQLANDGDVDFELEEPGNEDDFDDFDNDDDDAGESDDFSELDNEEDFDDGREKAYLKKMGLYRKQIRSIDDLVGSYKHLEKKIHSDARKNKRRRMGTDSPPAPASTGITLEQQLAQIQETMKTNPVAGTAQVFQYMVAPLIKKMGTMERGSLASSRDFSPEMVDILDEVAEDYPELEPEAQVYIARGKASEQMAEHDRERHERRGAKKENQRTRAYREPAGNLRVRTTSSDVGQVLGQMKAKGMDHRKMRKYLQQRKLAD